MGDDYNGRVLAALELKDFAIVDELRLELSPGLNALTGETGAGKSILVDALAQLIGGRADTGLIRSGCESALVQGLFEGVGLESAARRLQANGRSAARIDGELVTVGELAERGSRVIAIHGQQAAQALGAGMGQREQLDRLLPEEAAAELVAYRRAYAEHQAAGVELAELREAERERARRLDILRYQLEEIDAARLAPGEEERLEEQAEQLRHAEAVTAGAARALAALLEMDDNAVELLAAATRDLEAAARHAPGLTPLAAELREAVSAVQATGQEIEAFLADFEADPAALERGQARLAELAALKRKYGDSVEAVLAYREGIAEELARLERAEHEIGELEERLERLAGELRSRGEAVRAARERAAAHLGREAVKHLKRLGMPGARFEVRLEPLPEPGRHGLERVRFMFGANPGEPLAELTQVASGGELSRLMLALALVTGSDRPVLVFDEVDAGTGGRTARAVGALLKHLAHRHQVLVVTHLPQVAAFADAQFYLEKVERDGRTVTRATRLSPGERERELARMLSGSVTEASLSNARELLRDAQAESASA